MNEKTMNDMASEPVAHTYGMSSALLESGLLGKVRGLSREDKSGLIRYMIDTADADIEDFQYLDDEQQPYTLEELNARIDEAEAEIDRGEGKSFDEMMNDLRKELLWLK